MFVPTTDRRARCELPRHSLVATGMLCRRSFKIDHVVYRGAKPIPERLKLMPSLGTVDCKVMHNNHFPGRRWIETRNIVVVLSACKGDVLRAVPQPHAAQTLQRD